MGTRCWKLTLLSLSYDLHLSLDAALSRQAQHPGTSGTNEWWQNTYLPTYLPTYTHTHAECWKRKSEFAACVPALTTADSCPALPSVSQDVARDTSVIITRCSDLSDDLHSVILHAY